jgi:hypothetical protein
MARIEIYIDGIKADLPEKDLNLNLTFALKDRNGIAINSGSRSEYSFDLPATKQNDYIFSRFHDVGEVTLQRQELLPAIIIVDGLPFFEGKAQVRSVTTQQDRFYWKGLSYKVSFYGNNVDWVADLKEKFIYQLDFGTITLGANQNLSAYSNDYAGGFNFCTLVMKFKNWAVFGQVDTFSESFPALFVKTIVDKIFLSLGYTVNSNVFNTDWFKQLIVPIPVDTSVPVNDEQYEIDYLNTIATDLTLGTGGFVGIYVFPIQTTFPLIGPNPYNNVTGIYTVPQDGYYLARASFTVSNQTTTCGMLFGFGINGAPPVQVYGQSAATSYSITTTVTGEYVFLLNAGDTIDVRVASAAPLGNTFDVNGIFEVQGQAIITDPITLDFKYLINKQWRQLDFIKGLAHLLNLTFETNVALRTVTIEPSDNYLYTYPGANNIEQGFYNKSFSDLTRKVDLNITGELFNIDDFERSIQFIYKEDSNDPTVEALNQGQNVPMAGAQFNFPVTRLKSGITDIENPFFCPTLNFLDDEIRGVGSASPIYVPFIWPENYLDTPTATQGNYDIGPRILFKDKDYLSNPSNPTFVINDPTSPGTLTIPFPSAFMQNYNSPGVYQSLVFGSETINGVYVKGLLERFYLAEMIRRMYGKQMEVYMFWDVLMLNNLTFRNTIQIHGDNYILNEINSFSVVNQRSTKTYLTYDAKGDGTEVNNIENTAILTKYIP